MTPSATSGSVRSEYAALAARYDRRWARYVERTLALLRPWMEGADLGSVLDVGCGTAALLPRLSAWSARFDRYTGLDLSPEMLRMARAKAGDAARAAFVAGSAEALPFRAGAFDTAVSASAMHYWEAPDAALAEIRRVLRPRGRLLLLDWQRDPWPMRIADAAMRAAGVRYVRTWSRGEAVELLGGAGFRIAGETRGSAGSFWRVMAFDAAAPPR
ncbi:MAG TPA: class I SAM-dependent methyltransferase [Longimicrobium sp.]|nr:class I SAM-dependent methyltransferase [Longimicrobium sp.]